jgi:hypothetical protein
MRRLTIDDIADQREYERDREEFRARIIELKRRRRVGVGPFVTMLFENRETIRFQVQEMARAERMVSDSEIQHELDVYNPLIPEEGQLSATLFIELTSKDALKEWLPKLVGIERSVRLELGEGSPEVVTADVEESHEEQLTREEVTASVHYVRFRLTPEQVDAFEAGPVALAVEHPAYSERTPLADDTHAELLADLRP